VRTLGFERRCRIVGGRRVRASLFESRSTLPVSAACLVANAARQTLAGLFGTAVTLRLLEPVLPDRAGWGCIGADARIFAVRGENADAAFVLRREDALAIAGAAFGERVAGQRALSAIEAELLARVVSALCETLGPVCGARKDSRISRTSNLDGYVTYFEIILEEPVEARIGIAMSREPSPHVVSAFRADDLEGIELDLSVEIAHGFLSAASIVMLRPGELVKLDSALGERALLHAETTIVAQGESGWMNGRAVLVVQ